MRTPLIWTTLSVCALLAGCASTEDVRALRRPILPPDHVALADLGSPLNERVAIYEILGAPEFRLLDEGDLITTRPTRGDVARMLSAWLSNAGLLAENIDQSHYLMTVEFLDLHGPDVIPFTDKHASGRVRYLIIERRGGRVIFDQTYDASMQARMPGVTEEMVRAAIRGGVLGALAGEAINELSDGDAVLAGAVAGGIIGADAADFTGAHDTLLWDWPVAVLDEIVPRIERGAGLGIKLGALTAPDMNDSNSVPGARTAGAALGAATAFLAAAPTGRPPMEWTQTEVPGAFWGTDRRDQAVRGMMKQNFNAFLFGLAEAQMLTIREAVDCEELNPGGYGGGFLLVTRDRVGYNCPGGPIESLRDNQPRPPR